MSTMPKGPMYALYGKERTEAGRLRTVIWGENFHPKSEPIWASGVGPVGLMD